MAIEACAFFDISSTFSAVGCEGCLSSVQDDSTESEEDIKCSAKPETIEWPPGPLSSLHLASLASLIVYSSPQNMYAELIARARSRGETASNLLSASFRFMHKNNSFASCWLEETADAGILLVVAVRGTQVDVAEDILDDCDVRLVQVPWADENSRMHRGFLKHFYRIQTDILASCTLFKEYPILLTGHSLGGAVALTAASQLLSLQQKNNLFRLRGVYTFGAPKIGNAAFAKWISRSKTASFVSVEAEGDVVPSLPMKYATNWKSSLLKLKYTCDPENYKAGTSAWKAHSMRGYARKCADYFEETI